MVRSFGVQSYQLLTEGQVFEDEVPAGTQSTNNPAEEMSEQHDHGQNLTLTCGECRRF